MKSTTASTAAAPTMSPMTLEYPFAASQASCHRPRAAQAVSGTRENIAAIAATNSRKDFM